MRRTGFYLGIWLMFVVAELFAGGHRFYVPVFELIVIWGMSYFSAICVNKHCLKLLLNICVYVYLCIYILQCFYYGEMGEFIPVLALQNYECAYLMIRGGYIAAIIGVMVIIYVYHKYVRIEAFKKMAF